MDAFDSVRQQVEFDPSSKFRWKQPVHQEDETKLDLDLLARIEESFHTQ
jgi:hypothetical protein